MKFIPYVNVCQGTASSPRFSNGNTLPLTQRPWGMVAFMPQTEEKRRGWYYHPADRSLEGVRVTHQPSPWIGDFGSLLFMPQAGVPETSAARRWSGYRPEEAELAPHYLKVNFLRARASFELTPAERGGIIRVQFAKGESQRFLSIIRTDHDFSVRISDDNRLVFGFTNAHTFDVPAGYGMHFVLEFDSDIDVRQSITEEGEAIHLALTKPEVTVKFAISFISREQALRNLHTELGALSFDELKGQTEARWEELLGRVEIGTQDKDMMRTFYSCLYRIFTFPNKMYEWDENGCPIHYDSFGDRVKEGYLYTNNGFWDTYRTVYPLYALIAPEAYREILDGYLQLYDNTGWLPKWPSLTETGFMPGTLIDAVIADAAVKGLLKGDKLRKAWNGMCRHAMETAPEPFGRKAIEEYIRYGYVPRESARESVNATQDYAYGDFCIARVAELLGETESASLFDERSLGWRQLFDPETGFLRGRDRAGKMDETFHEFRWGGEYTEGGAWQNSFAAYHDLDGLAELHGGTKVLVEKLDTLFSTPPLYTVGGYGSEIHEMTEMAAVDYGQCAISNQPSFHLPWLYAMLGEPEKAAMWVKTLASEAFSWKADGFPGDEDNGTTSGWYIFACMGFYPICPGKPEYVKTEMLVDKLRLMGKTIDISSFETVFRHERLAHMISND